jgi:hypothetical protein
VQASRPWTPYSQSKGAAADSITFAGGTLTIPE